MPRRLLFTGMLVALAIVAVARHAAAETAAPYTVAPAGPVDPRNNFPSTNGAVFIVDNAKGQISMCYPDSKDGKIAVSCTLAIKLTQYSVTALL